MTSSFFFSLLGGFHMEWLPTRRRDGITIYGWQDVRASSYKADSLTSPPSFSLHLLFSFSFLSHFYIYLYIIIFPLVLSHAFRHASASNDRIFSVGRVVIITIYTILYPPPPFPSIHPSIHPFLLSSPRLSSCLFEAVSIQMPAYYLQDCHYFYRSALRLLSVPTLLSAQYA